LQLSEVAAAAMIRYHWPGNVRALRNAMERAAVLCDGDTVKPASLPEAVVSRSQSAHQSLTKARLDHIERQHIAHVLLASAALLIQGAALLDISVSALRRTRALYNIDIPIRRAPKRKLI